MQLLVDNILTHYEIVNPKAKKDFLILHGWGHTSYQHWDKVAHLLDTSYRYILLSMPGFGGTQLLPPHPNVPEYTEFVYCFIKKMNLKSPIVFGHSFGGQVATNLAITHPDLLSHLILDAPASLRFKTPKEKLKLAILKYLKPLKQIVPEFILRPIIGRISSSDYYNADSAHKEILKRIVRYDLAPHLHKITAPTLINWGENDQEIPNRGVYLVEYIKNARLRIIYNSGHNSHLDNPRELAESINHYLEVNA